MTLFSVKTSFYLANIFSIFKTLIFKNFQYLELGNIIHTRTYIYIYMCIIYYNLLLSFLITIESILCNIVNVYFFFCV